VADVRFEPLLDFPRVGAYGTFSCGLTALALAGARGCAARVACVKQAAKGTAAHSPARISK